MGVKTALKTRLFRAAALLLAVVLIVHISSVAGRTGFLRESPFKTADRSNWSKLTIKSPWSSSWSSSFEKKKTLVLPRPTQQPPFNKQTTKPPSRWSWSSSIERPPAPSWSSRGSIFSSRKHSTSRPVVESMPIPERTTKLPLSSSIRSSSSANKKTPTLCKRNSRGRPRRQVNNSMHKKGGNTIDDKSQCKTSGEIFLEDHGPCGDNNSGGRFTDIGWKEGNESRELIITVCHNMTRAATLYTNHTIEIGERAANQKNRRPRFRADYVADSAESSKSVEKHYTRTRQKEAIKDSHHEYFIDDRENRTTHFLARGHLAPYGDFIDEDKRDATFFLINAAPQWQSFNAKNWAALENSIRKRVNDIQYQRTFHIYTGVYGVLKRGDLGFKSDANEPIYLVPDKKLLPVPKFFWKVVHDPGNEMAVAFVGLNNPHLKDPKDAEEAVAQLCPVDRCDAMETWVPDSWWQKSVQDGYMRCCLVQELRAKVTYMPDLGKAQNTILV